MTPRPTITVVPTPKLTGLLRRGNSGDQVLLLQQRLRELGYLTQKADGIFGSATEKALIAFQNFNGLTPDGAAGQQTLEKLYSDDAIDYRTPSPAPSMTPAPAVSASASVSPSVSGSAMPAGTNMTILPTIQATVPVVTLAPDSSAAGPTAAPVDVTRMIPTAGQVINVNWYTSIRGKAKASPDVIIYDPQTGTRYQVHLFSFGKHADGETPTAVDTALMYQVCGNNNWTPHAVWVIFDDGSVYLASTHSHGHGVDHTAGNNLDGHICVHFPRLMYEAEETGPYAVSHQKAILAEWERIQLLLKSTAEAQ